jgi:hypothetical protein
MAFFSIPISSGGLYRVVRGWREGIP